MNLGLRLETSQKAGISPSFKLGLLLVLVIACCAADLSRIIGPSVLATIALLAALLSRLPLRLLLTRLLPLISFSVIGLALLIFAPLGPGTATIELPYWGREVSKYTFDFLLAIGVKSTLIVVMISAFAQTMTERDVLAGLTGLRLPAKVVALCYMMLRGLHSVRDEVLRLARGRDARGKPRGIRAIKVAGAMTQVLMVRLARRAEVQALALASRGFDGRLALSEWQPLSAPQLLALIASAVGLLCLTRL